MQYIEMIARQRNTSKCLCHQDGDSTSPPDSCCNIHAIVLILADTFSELSTSMQTLIFPHSSTSSSESWSICHDVENGSLRHFLFGLCGLSFWSQYFTNMPAKRRCVRLACFQCWASTWFSICVQRHGLQVA